MNYFPAGPGKGNEGAEPGDGGSSSAATRNLTTTTAPAKNTRSRPILLQK